MPRRSPRRSTRLAANQAATVPSTNPQATLEALPPEILRQIFCYLCPHCCAEKQQPLGPPYSKNDEERHGLPNSHRVHLLLDLCLLSRRMCGVAQEVLYHMFSFHPFRGIRYQREPVFKWGHRIMAFARTVTQRRDLACAVRVIVFDMQLFWAIDSILPRDVGEISRQAAEAHGVDLCGAWRRRLQTDEEWPPEFQTMLETFLDDGPTRRRIPRKVRPEVLKEWLIGELFTILIASLPKLEYINLQPQIKASLFHPPVLRALGTVNLPVKTLEMTSWIPTMLQFATNLETLTLNRTCVLYRIPPLPKLKSLKIKQMWLSVSQLKYVFSACTGELRNFVYCADIRPASNRTLRDRIRMFREDDSFLWPNYESADLVGLEDDQMWGEIERSADVMDVVECLKGHRESLTSLHLQLSSLWMTQRRMPHMRQFSVLKDICISLSILGDNTASGGNDKKLLDLLPASTESVLLTNPILLDLDVVESNIFHLVDGMRRDPTRLPKLKRVLCEHMNMSPNKMVSSLATVGVHFEYKVWTGDWGLSMSGQDYIEYIETGDAGWDNEYEPLLFG